MTNRPTDDRTHGQRMTAHAPTGARGYGKQEQANTGSMTPTAHDMTQTQTQGQTALQMTAHAPTGARMTNGHRWGTDQPPTDDRHRMTATGTGARARMGARMTNRPRMTNPARPVWGTDDRPQGHRPQAN